MPQTPAGADQNATFVIAATRYQVVGHEGAVGMRVEGGAAGIPADGEEQGSHAGGETGEEAHDLDGRLGDGEGMGGAQPCRGSGETGGGARDLYWTVGDGEGKGAHSLAEAATAGKRGREDGRKSPGERGKSGALTVKSKC
jgi:hypothetical protein